MRFENTKKMFAYWQNLRGDRPAPERSEIEPSDIRTLLGDTFILEIDHGAKAISYRLAGTRLCTAHARELKGLGYLAHWAEEDNFEIMQALSRTYSNFEPALLSYLAETEERRFVEYESLLLPLQPIDANTSRILGISSPKTIPFWIGAEPVVNNRLRSVRFPEVNNPDRLSAEHVEAPSMQHGVPGGEKRGPSMQRDADVGRKVGHLMVLEGGKSE